MANWIKWSALTLLLLILLNEVDFSAGRGGRGGGRGGRGGGRWGGRGRGGSRSSGRSRAYKGTYGLTRSTWKASFTAGTIYGGHRYLRSSRYHHHPDRMPTICRNTLATDVNGTVLNLFVCPRFNESDDYEYCCGEKDREYCCKYFDSQWKTIVISVSVSVSLLILGIVAYCLWKAKVCKKGEKDSTPHTMEMKEPGAPPPYSEPPAYMTTISGQTDPYYPEKPRI